MLTVFLKLLIAHFLGDFLLQPKSWVSKRRDNIYYLLLHVLIHVSLLSLVLISDWKQYWVIIVSIGCAHLAIDSMKIWWEKLWPYRPVLLFILDQFLHVSVLVAVLFYYFGVPDGLCQQFSSDTALLYFIALLLIAIVSPIFLRVFFSKWDYDNTFASKKEDSLMDAGMLIGIMERLLIVLFIQVGFLAGIGFLLAAKSIFRFGDLTNAKDTKFTEYILVGTLVSYVIAIAVGYLLKIGLMIV